MGSLGKSSEWQAKQYHTLLHLAIFAPMDPARVCQIMQCIIWIDWIFLSAIIYPGLSPSELRFQEEKQKHGMGKVLSLLF